MSAGPNRDGRIDGETQGSGGSAEAYCAVCNLSYPIGERTCPIDGSQLVMLPEQRDEMLGRVLEGRFEIREHIGAGGMGTVYRAYQSSVGRDVAVKVIDPTVSRDRETVKRFMREAQLASKLSHPNTVVVHDFGQTHDGVVFLVMEMIEGRTLRQVLRETGPLPLRRLVRMAIQLCDALHTAHALGIIHRDLKPGNVMILDHPVGRDQLKVLDFGLAKSLAQDVTAISSSHLRMGTPMYMSPEMIRAEDVDERSDLYALGCTLYEMAMGRPPFVARNAEMLFAQHLEETPPPLEREELGELAEVILALLAKNPADRPASADTVREVFQQCSVELASGELPVMRRAGIADTDDAANPMLRTSSKTKVRNSAAQAATVDLRTPDLESLSIEPLKSLTPTPEARSRSRRPLLLGLALAVVAAAAVSFYVLELNRDDSRPRNSRDQPATTPEPRDERVETRSTSTPSPVPTAAPITRADAGAAVPANVTLSLASTPAARVTVNGTPAGKTPATYQLARGDRAVEVVFERPGYLAKKLTVVPDRDQTIEATLGLSPRPHRKYRRTKAPRKAPVSPVEPPKVKPPVTKPTPKKGAEPKKDPEPIFRLRKKAP